MNKDIFCTVKELLYSRDCVLMGNAVNNDGKLYDDSFENLTAILAMKDSYAEMLAALEVAYQALSLWVANECWEDSDETAMVQMWAAIAKARGEVA